MPLPAASETAADQVQRIGRQIDQAAADHIVNGDPMPSPDQFARSVRPRVRAGVAAAMRDIDPDVDDDRIRQAADRIVARLVDMYRTAKRDAERRRRRILRASPIDDDDDGASLPVLARRVGFAAAVATIAARTGSRRRPSYDDVKKAGTVGGQPLPTRLEARLRAEVRTSTAVARNDHAADVVEERGEGWALYIRDALAGSDEPCVRVDRKWATVAWLRNHPVEHPNCTREGRPRRLPPGARITLIR